jgi:hypothetical protein
MGLAYDGIEAVASLLPRAGLAFAHLRRFDALPCALEAAARAGS